MELGRRFRKCEEIAERTKTSRAKSQSCKAREENEAVVLCVFFAPWRLCVRLLIFSRLLISRVARPYLVIALASVFFIVIAGERSPVSVGAHKPVTSKYDYNKDVFPLLLNHCARCHVEGGPAPMSLMTYNDAVPWAEAIREEVTAGRMPPWPVDPTSPPVNGGYPINSRDINTIVVWASGGTPQGDPGIKLPTVRSIAVRSSWPDLTIPMDVEHTVAPDTIEETLEFSLPTKLTETKWVKTTELIPGNASIVRDAVISIENGPVLALWQPGEATAATSDDAAFRLAPGSKIHLQIHYKKHFDQERNAVSDKSMIGLYFTDPPPSGRELQSFTIAPPKATGDPSGTPLFAGTLPEAARIVALRPILDRAYESLDVDAITPSGTRVPLLRLRGPRPQWLRRYWLQEPVQLASGSKIQVHATPLSDDSDEPKATKELPFQVILDYVPQ